MGHHPLIDPRPVAKNQPPRPRLPKTVPFTLVAIPDTQVYAKNDLNWVAWSRVEILTQMTSWIADNTHRHNIRFALHMGDIVTTHDSPDEMVECQ